MKRLDASFSDLSVILDVSRSRSIRQTARELKLDPAQVSRTVRDFESALDSQFFERSSSGMVLTDQGTKIIPMIEKVLSASQDLRDFSKGEGDVNSGSYMLSISATSFLVRQLIVPAAKELFKRPGLRMRFLELPPSDLVVHGIKGAFQMVCHIGKVDWPRTWTSVKVGRIKWGLYGRPKFPKSMKKEQACNLPFVTPIYWSTSGLVQGEDHCPLPRRRRKIWSETSTADSAKHLILLGDSVSYLPEILVRSELKSGELREIVLSDADPVYEPLYLTVKNDRVTKVFFDSFRTAIQGYLKV